VGGSVGHNIIDTGICGVGGNVGKAGKFSTLTFAVGSAVGKGICVYCGVKFVTRTGATVVEVNVGVAEPVGVGIGVFVLVGKATEIELVIETGSIAGKVI
jgi:hypothetical protein